MLRLRGLGFWAAAAVVAEVVVAAADAMGAVEEAKRSVGVGRIKWRTREVGNFPAWDSGGLGIGSFSI
jgi:hypothetical protein